jgi:nucleosome binding factor SPN SPT16 subunit
VGRDDVCWIHRRCATTPLFLLLLDVQVQDIVSRVKNGFHEFDIPSRDIAFSGAPFKENVLLLPCTTCLVSLTDRPVRLCSIDFHIVDQN